MPEELPLELIRPSKEHHAEGIFDLTGKAFSGGDNYYEWVRSAPEYFGEPFYDWSASTVGLHDGRVVTHWGVWGYRMRVGRSKVRVAGIGAVATDGLLRKSGLMRRTIRAALPAMREADYDLSVLFGIGDFYDKFGYCRAWPDRVIRLRCPRDLPRKNPPFRTRKLAKADFNERCRLYNRSSRGLTGTAVKPTYPTWDFSPGKIEGVKWHREDGRLAGYVVFQIKKELVVRESAGPAADILAVIGEKARELHCHEVVLPCVHPRSDLARAIHRGSYRLEQKFSRSGGAMIRTLELRGALAAIEGELSARLKDSVFSNYRGKLLLDDGREKAELKLAGGKVSAGRASGRYRNAIRGRDEIAQLLIGTDAPDRVIYDASMRTTGDAAALAGVLFPAQEPTLAAMDHF